MSAFMRLERNSDTATVFGNKISAIRLANNPMSSSRSSHIDTNHQFISGVVERGDIKIVRLQTRLKPSDLLTKTLNGDAFSEHWRYAMNLTVNG